MVLAGTAGTLIFGVWLAISKDPYDALGRLDHRRARALGDRRLDGTGGRQGIRERRDGGKAARRGRDQHERDRRGDVRALPAFKMHLASNVAIVLLIFDMIWKPGA